MSGGLFGQPLAPLVQTDAGMACPVHLALVILVNPGVAQCPKCGREWARGFGIDWVPFLGPVRQGPPAGATAD